MTWEEINQRARDRVLFRRRWRRRIPVGLLCAAFFSFSLLGLHGTTVAIAAIAVIACAWALAADARDGRILNRVRSNRCWRCGYSLAGNVSGRCPECGSRDISTLLSLVLPMVWFCSIRRSLIWVAVQLATTPSQATPAGCPGCGAPIPPPSRPVYTRNQSRSTSSRFPPDNHLMWGTGTLTKRPIPPTQKG